MLDVEAIVLNVLFQVLQYCVFYSDFISSICILKQRSETGIMEEIDICMEVNCELTTFVN